ncbi:ATP-dependent RNA helicase [Photobacterium kishitanii]|uniref:DEAD/DEAH box helicase n=1 Tax=Photobacterium kishitanii TaxID=318456 RepID=UPI0007EF42CC|nr:DEAD/DEAH box helicase [Photobacterium kishitanii]OBU27253.1 RNA helicase [Photobacterium kishitanii]PSW67785.1 ATP-dependent RNA helicase [Photobacterium kishitanii]
MSFASLGLSAPILEAVAKQGYEKPSPIQAQAIPAILEGKDVMAAAQTGTGKTAGFTLPLLEKLSGGRPARSNHIRALILTPTRELAAQVGENVAKYSKNLPINSAVVFGGVKANPQMVRLRQGADVLVATPGRLMDLHSQNAVKFRDVEILVLDEADRMLDMGFIRDIRKILALLPKQRQNLLFSATFSDDIRALAKGLVNNPVEIDVNPRNQTAPTVKQWIFPVDQKKKANLLTKLLNERNWKQVLVFTKTKHGANRLATHLESRGISSAAIHGNKSQGARTKALANFKSGEVRVLVATDIAARGLDIEQLPQVVNFELPHVAEDYVHRIGRTGRAGCVGEAISLVCADEFGDLIAIERMTKQILEREIVEGFEPSIKLPVSRLDTRPLVAKKPKKPQSFTANGEKRPRSNGKPTTRRKPTARSDDAPRVEGAKPARKPRPTDAKPKATDGKPSRRHNDEKPKADSRRSAPQRNRKPAAAAVN